MGVVRAGAFLVVVGRSGMKRTVEAQRGITQILVRGYFMMKTKRGVEAEAHHVAEGHNGRRCDHRGTCRRHAEGGDVDDWSWDCPTSSRCASPLGYDRANLSRLECSSRYTDDCGIRGWFARAAPVHEIAEPRGGGSVTASHRAISPIVPPVFLACLRTGSATAPIVRPYFLWPDGTLPLTMHAFPAVITAVWHLPAVGPYVTESDLI